MTTTRLESAADAVDDLQHHLSRLAGQPAKLTTHLAGPHHAATIPARTAGNSAALHGMHQAAHRDDLAKALAEFDAAEAELDALDAVSDPHCEFCQTTGSHGNPVREFLVPPPGTGAVHAHKGCFTARILASAV
jgi:hypothetical protein